MLSNMTSLSNAYYNVKTANGNAKIIIAHFLIVMLFAMHFLRATKQNFCFLIAKTTNKSMQFLAHAQFLFFMVGIVS